MLKALINTIRSIKTSRLGSCQKLGLILVCTALATGPALATPDQPTSTSPAQALGFDLQSYSPDQSLWADKMKAKYEKAKYTEEQPLAVLKIARLNLEAPIYIGTDRITLDRGLGHVENTAQPGEIGNVALSGHRDSFFRVLKDIKVGDTIEMRTAKGIENFQVSDISIVDALEVSVLDPTDSKVLTLITCHPFYYQGYAPDRYIVRATPVNQ
jgi:sortase A